MKSCSEFENWIFVRWQVWVFNRCFIYVSHSNMILREGMWILVTLFVVRSRIFIMFWAWRATQRGEAKMRWAYFLSALNSGTPANLDSPLTWFDQLYHSRLPLRQKKPRKKDWNNHESFQFIFIRLQQLLRNIILNITNEQENIVLLREQKI